MHSDASDKSYTQNACLSEQTCQNFNPKIGVT